MDSRMCHKSTFKLVAFALAASGLSLSAQVPRPDWRRIGNSSLDLALASPASGPVERVWYSDDGAQLFARGRSGRTYVTGDFEVWTAAPEATAAAPAAVDAAAPVRPELLVRIRGQQRSSKLYAIGRFVYRSEDGGRNWANLTRFREQSLIGEGVADLAVSPRDADEITVAAQTGVWRSLDGGLSWNGVNQSLPNLPVRRVLGFPADTRGVRVAVEAQGSLVPFEWMPGGKQAWRRTQDEALGFEAALKAASSASLKSNISAVATAGEYVYAGSIDGVLWVSTDRGRTWRKNPDTLAAPVEQIFIDPRDSRLAIAVLGAKAADAPTGARATHVVRILNAGALFDDLTANLPDVAVHGVAADRGTGAVYVATERGVYLAFEDLVNAAPAAQWTALTDGIPAGAAFDVKLGPDGNQLYAAIDGFGVYATPAPHRFRDVRIVNAADMLSRPAAPGSLLSVLGANVRSARAGTQSLPIFPGSELRSEIQVPFEARGTSLALALESSAGALTVGVPLQAASPAIFVDRDGSPMLLDAESGVLLDTMTPAHSNSRLQILATGLGRVRPDWPTGLAGPVENAPQVIADVRAYVDRVPVEVTRATLAPGYVGFYLIEVQLPKLVNYGPAELYIEAAGQPSNRVRVYIEP